MRIRKKPWSDSEMELAKGSYLPDDPAAIKGRWSEEFGNDNPIHLEIGCGKGRFVNALAIQNPDINYIALEKEEMVCVMALKQSRLNDSPPNLRYIIADASQLEEFFERGEVSRMYINFPDPWHRKKRWIRRRLTHSNFLELYEELFPGCELFLKTDNVVFFDFSLIQLKNRGWQILSVTRDLHNSEFKSKNVVTEYEEKFSSEGIPIMQLNAKHVVKDTGSSQMSSPDSN